MTSTTRRRLVRRPSPAFVVASVALFVGLGGGAYAATELPSRSVGARQLRTGAVTSTAVRNGSLRATDFAPGQLPAGQKGQQGPQGLRGAQGPKGDRGPAGIAGTVVRVSAGMVSANSLAAMTVTCHSGEVALGGGVSIGTGGNDAWTQDSRPDIENDGTAFGWSAIVGNPTGTNLAFKVYAICAKLD
jgi:hypothetical protein